MAPKEATIMVLEPHSASSGGAGGICGGVEMKERRRRRGGGGQGVERGVEGGG